MEGPHEGTSEDDHSGEATPWVDAPGVPAWAAELPRWPQDDSGYWIQQRDLEFQHLTREQVEWWARRQAPLGMTPQQYQEFTASLLDTLRKAGVPPAEVDARMHGSSAVFFSGFHKALSTAESLASNPAALARLQEWFGSDQHRPLRRPFDAEYRLGTDPEPSDYDLNISNDRMVEVARKHWQEENEKSMRETGKDKYGDFIMDHGYVNPGVIVEVYPQLQDWAKSWGGVLHRRVTFAVFPSSGPLERSLRPGAHSVPFRDTDWMVHEVGSP